MFTGVSGTAWPIEKGTPVPPKGTALISSFKGVDFYDLYNFKSFIVEFYLASIIPHQPRHQQIL